VLSGDQQDLKHLAALAMHQLRDRIERGERATAAEYLLRFPKLRSCEELVVELVYEEYYRREERGEFLDDESFSNGYPEWKDEILSQLDTHHLLSEAADKGRRRRDLN
jgi:hypothetical protein